MINEVGLGSSGHGQADTEGGALIQLGLHGDGALVFFDKLAGNQKAETSSLWPFSAEKGGEEFGLDFFAHSVAVVSDVKTDGLVFVDRSADFNPVDFTQVGVIAAGINGIAN